MEFSPRFVTQVHPKGTEVQVMAMENCAGEFPIPINNE